MTRTEIMNMTPGAELDRAVAEKVMGWEAQYIQNRDETGQYVYVTKGIGWVTVDDWQPSQNIAHAKEVEMVMINRGWYVNIVKTPPPHYRTACVFYLYYPEYVCFDATCDTECEAISKTAMIAVEV